MGSVLHNSYRALLVAISAVAAYFSEGGTIRDVDSRAQFCVYNLTRTVSLNLSLLCEETSSSQLWERRKCGECRPKVGLQYDRWRADQFLALGGAPQSAPPPPLPLEIADSVSEPLVLGIIFLPLM
ncbi:hypothetical protein J6590_033210 [Homalodisca vitripennis]|nr:hypothetical protein J6590_033210 [Homalodisca vitripennis]